MPMQETITQLLTDALQPVFLEVLDESYQHASGADAQSHFKVVIAAEQFAGTKLLQRHRTINGVLQEVLTQIHALALHTYTPAEWAERDQAPDSPVCQGGSKA